MTALGAPVRPFAPHPAGPSPEEEARWVRRGAAGDREALAAIVRAHQERLFRVLLRWSGDRELARDLTQDTFVRAFQALDRFGRGRALAPWLFTIANRLFLDHVRRTRPISLEEAGPAADPGREDPALAQVLTDLVLAEALDQLPARWRQALVLRHVEDLAYEQVAEVLEVPLGTVKTWIFRGRDRLRELLGDAGRGE